MKLGYRLYMFMWAIIWNFDRETHVSSKMSCQLSPEITKNNGEC